MVTMTSAWLLFWLPGLIAGAALMHTGLSMFRFWKQRKRDGKPKPETAQPRKVTSW